ncbi:MAG TPA: hypothetical protein DDW65_17960 [Firmicutes bacterium]|jgi:two-component system, response regulator YesN|nr:hypothetical protein [Bacillota bacterium]
MWRVILVEDEEFVRAELAALFPWRDYRFELIGEAESGRNAIQLIATTNPDLVITDIRMGPMDGLELTSWLVIHRPEIVVAIVSAYNDFPLVREALRLGAVDYLIKAEATMETAGIFLKRMVGILEQRNLVRCQQQELTNCATQYQLLAVRSFWRDILSRSSDETETELKAGQLGINLQQKGYGLVLVHVVNDNEGIKKKQIVACKTFEEALLHRLNLGGNWTWNIVDLNHGDFVIVANYRDEDEDEDEDPTRESIQMLQDFACFLTKDLSEKWVVSVSPGLCSFAELPGYYREVREMNLLRIFNSDRRYFHIEDLLVLRERKFPKLPELLAAWEGTLERADIHAIQDFLNHTFDKIIPSSFCPSEARWLTVDLINILRRVSYEYQVGWKEVGTLADNLPDFLEQAESIKEWQELIERLATHYTQSVQTHLNPRISSSIRKALAFIQTNFSRDLSLDEVAEHSGVSKSYLCRTFSEYTGEHFGDYLQRLRIDRAKQLLVFTNERIYEIATKVGFWNSRYFSKVFHDVVGMTPADYRRTPLSETTENVRMVEEQLR